MNMTTSPEVGVTVTVSDLERLGILHEEAAPRRFFIQHLDKQVPIYLDFGDTGSFAGPLKEVSFFITLGDEELPDPQDSPGALLTAMDRQYDRFRFRLHIAFRLMISSEFHDAGITTECIEEGLDNSSFSFCKTVGSTDELQAFVSFVHKFLELTNSPGFFSACETLGQTRTDQLGVLGIGHFM